MTAATQEVAGLSLSADEAAAVADAAEAFATALPTARAVPYRELAHAARTGSVPAGLLVALEQVCRLALQSGKSRELGRAESERLLGAVLRRTPAGRSAAAEVDAVNRALAELTGRQLESVRLTARLPGYYVLTVAAGGFELAVAIEPEGTGFRSVAAG